MALLSDRESGIAVVEYSFFSFLFALPGVIISSLMQLNIRSGFFAGALLGVLIGFLYRKTFEPRLLTGKKEIAAAALPLLISPVLSGISGLITIYRN